MADMVGLSFVQEPDDVVQILKKLKTRKGDHVHVVLKIETLKGFEHLPGLMLAAMAVLNKGSYITDAIRMLDDILRHIATYARTPVK